MEQARVREAAVARPKLVLRGGASEEEAQAFRDAVKRESGAIEEAVTQQVEERLTQREQLFNDLLWRFWNDATWMATGQGFLGFFPDGRPKTEQHPWHLAIWSIFISAIVKRANTPQKTPPRGDEHERTKD